MAKIKGICKNIDGCDLAAEKAIQEKDSFDFKCDECGKELYPIEEKKKKKKGMPVPLMAGTVLAALVIIGGICYLLMGGEKGSSPQEPIAIPDSIAQKDSSAATPITINNTVIIGDSVAKRDTVIRLDTITQRDTIVQRDTIIQRDTVKVNVPVRTNRSNATPAKSSGTLRLSYGSYTGDVQNGKPHGMGRLTFNTSRQIESRDARARVAESGDYVIGEFSEGHLVQGTWYGADNQVKGSLLIGK